MTRRESTRRVADALDALSFEGETKEHESTPATSSRDDIDDKLTNTEAAESRRSRRRRGASALDALLDEKETD